MLEACAPTFLARSGSASSMNLRTASLLGSRPRITIGSSLSSVLTLARAFRSWAERPIILNLSGGMRLLVVEALCAALISRVPMTVEVESEDGKALVAFSTDDLSFPEIDEIDRRIMESLARGVRTLDPLSERLGISKPTVWRRLRRLERARMVKPSKGRRREIAVDLTERGRIYCEVLPRVRMAQSTSPDEGSREAP
jgi:CRISPR locus-related DNA-binding protein